MTCRRRTAHPDLPLPTAVGALVVIDLVGGMLAVAAGVNTWTEAWGSAALLAAPVPMVLAQVGLTWLSFRLPGRWVALPVALLALACVVSVVSGFFDGGLGNDKLSGWLVAYQGMLLTATGVVGVLAAVRAFRVLARPARLAVAASG